MSSPKQAMSVLSGSRPGSRARTPSTATGGSSSPESSHSFGGVEDVFGAFCRARRQAAAAQGREERLRMDRRAFAQLCRDCGLLDQRFRPADADLVFAAAAGPGHRGLDLGRFEAALALAAERKGVGLAGVRAAVAGSPGPVLSGTAARAVRFYDGAAAPRAAAEPDSESASCPPLRWRSGPSWSESARLVDRVSTWIADLPENQGQRSETLAGCSWGRARSRTANLGRPLHRSRSALLDTDASPPSVFETVAHAHRAARKIGRNARAAGGDPVLELFKQFCGEHAGLMDVDGFEQLCRRCLLGVSGIDARAAFAAALPLGQTWLGINEFEDALEILARRKGQPVQALRSSIALCAPPQREVKAVDGDAPADPPDKDADYTVGGHRLPKLFRVRKGM